MEEKTFNCKVKEKAEEVIENIMNKDELSYDDIKIWYQAVDIHKDMVEEEKYEKEIEDMRYNMNGYSDYSEGPYGRNRYSTGRNYGRRGVPGTGRGRYRGDEMIDDMYQTYQEYAEGKERYGADQNSVKALQYMLKLDKKFIEMLEEEAQTPEEEELIRQHKMEMAQM